MRFAIPEFKGRVSPAFDFSSRIIVAEVSDDGMPETFPIQWSSSNMYNKIQQLKELKVETLLCGGISLKLARDVEKCRIQVIPGISGEVQEVIRAFISGGIPDPRLTMAGCIEGISLLRSNRQ